MANTVISLRSSGVTGNTPSLGVLANGELSLNFADGILYYKSAANTLGSIRTTQPAGLNTEIQFNDSGSFGANAAFTFNKAIATLNVTNINTSSLVTGGGVGGIISGANVIYSNTFVANTGGYFQFADGTRQYTANADGVFAQAAFDKANSANVLAQSAYDNSNTKFSSSGGTISGAVTVTGNVTTNQYFIGDGSKLTGLAPALQIYSLANTASGVSDYMVLKSLDAYTVGTQNTTTRTVTTTPTLLTSFISDVGFPNITSIPSGDIVIEFDTQKASGSQGYYCYAEIYKRTTGGTETLIATTENTSSSTLNSQIQQRANKYISTPIGLDISDRIVVKIYAVMLATSASISLLFDGPANGALTLPVLPASTLNFVPYINASANVQLNSYSLFANTVNANTVITNTYIQFADGSKQYTANAGSGGGGGGNSFGVIYTSNNNTYANASVSTDQLNFVGEAGVIAFANSLTKTITIAGTPGAQGLTVDYGYVYEAMNYSIDYGTL